MTNLLGGLGVVSASDFWMPDGFDQIEEAQLHRTPDLFPERPEICGQLRDWWLAVKAGRQTLPSFDIASTCTVAGRRGLLLIEAKAHEGELLAELKGKKLKADASVDSLTNHMRIGHAIADAAAHLQRAANWPWAISRDSRYQMSNRFAWAWRVASLDRPVVLVYVGFLSAREMPTPFASREAWEEAVYRHACGFVPLRAWAQSIQIKKGSVRALIASTRIDLPNAVWEPCDAD